MMKDEFSINLAEENESLGFDFQEQYVAGTSDYNKLKNKPTLNGNEIIGAMEEEDPTVSGWAKEPTKPSYTAEEVGAIKNDEIKAISLDELNSLWEGVQTWLQNIWTRLGRPYWSSQVSSAISTAVGKITQISYSKVSSLPATGATGVIYLVAHKHGTQDIYDEYIWMADSRTFEKIGTTDIDLSGYVKTTDLTAITTDELNAMWSAAQEVKTYARF